MHQTRVLHIRVETWLRKWSGSVLLWPNGLRLQLCYGRGLGRYCSLGLIPGPGTSTCHRNDKKKKKKSDKQYNIAVLKTSRNTFGKRLLNMCKPWPICFCAGLSQAWRRLWRSRGTSSCTWSATMHCSAGGYWPSRLLTSALSQVGFDSNSRGARVV